MAVLRPCHQWFRSVTFCFQTAMRVALVCALSKQMQHLKFANGIATSQCTGILCRQLLHNARIECKTLSRTAASGAVSLRQTSTLERGHDPRNTSQRMSPVAATSLAQAEGAKSLDAAGEVVVVTTVGCQFCKRAKESLQQSQVAFREIEASNQPDLLTRIKELTGRRTVPQVASSPHIDKLHVPLTLTNRGQTWYRSLWEDSFLVEQMT